MARFRLISATNDVETGKNRFRWQHQQNQQEKNKSLQLLLAQCLVRSISAHIP